MQSENNESNPKNEHGFSIRGNDIAYLTDTEEDDFLGGSEADLWMFNDDHFRFVRGFDEVFAGSLNGGLDHTDIEEIDFEVELYGNWA